jgi:hypothetical protein
MMRMNRREEDDMEMKRARKGREGLGMRERTMRRRERRWQAEMQEDIQRARKRREWLGCKRRLQKGV